MPVEIYHEGYLERKGALTWRKRYAILKNSTLTWYKDEQLLESQKSPLDLRQAISVKASTILNRDNPIEITYSGKTVIINAESSSSREKWIKYLRQAMKVRLDRREQLSFMSRPKCNSISSGSETEEMVQTDVAIDEPTPYFCKINNDGTNGQSVRGERFPTQLNLKLKHSSSSGDSTSPISSPKPKFRKNGNDINGNSPCWNVTGSSPSQGMTSLEAKRYRKLKKANSENIEQMRDKHPLRITNLEKFTSSNGNDQDPVCSPPTPVRSISEQPSTGSNVVMRRASTASIRSSRLDSSFTSRTDYCSTFEDDVDTDISHQDSYKDSVAKMTSAKLKEAEVILRDMSFDFPTIPSLPHPRRELNFDSPFDSIRVFIAQNRGPNEFYSAALMGRKYDFNQDGEGGAAIKKLEEFLVDLEGKDNGHYNTAL